MIMIAGQRHALESTTIHVVVLSNVTQVAASLCLLVHTRSTHPLLLGLKKCIRHSPCFYETHSWEATPGVLFNYAEQSILFTDVSAKEYRKIRLDIVVHSLRHELHTLQVRGMYGDPGVGIANEPGHHLVFRIMTCDTHPSLSNICLEQGQRKTGESGFRRGGRRDSWR